MISSAQHEGQPKDCSHPEAGLAQISSRSGPVTIKTLPNKIPQVCHPWNCSPLVVKGRIKKVRDVVPKLGPSRNRAEVRVSMRLRQPYAPSIKTFDDKLPFWEKLRTRLDFGFTLLLLPKVPFDI